MHTEELLYYILLSCFYDRPEDGILRKRISTFYSTDWFSQFHLFPRTMMYSGNISMIFSASVCKLLCLCRDMAHDTFSYEYPSYRIFFIRCMVGMLECTSDWYIFYSSYPARLSASSLTLQRAYDNMLNGMHTIPMIRIHTIHILLLMYQWLVHFHNKVYMSVFLLILLHGVFASPYLLFLADNRGRQIDWWSEIWSDFLLLPLLYFLTIFIL